MTDNANPPAPGNTPPPAPPPTDKPWFDGADQSIVAHLQQHGWDKKSANEAALAAAQSHLAASRLIGAPPESVIRLPKDQNDVEGWAKLYEKLGVPQNYTFGELKFADGTVVDKETTDWLTSVAKELHLTEAGAKTLATQLVKNLDKAASDEKAAETARRETAVAELKKNWGANWDANMFIAQRAAQDLGVKPEQLAALQEAVGYAHVMDMFRNIAAKLGEDKLVLSGPTGNVPMTRDLAINKRDQLMADEQWKARYLNGGRKELDEMMALNTIITGRAA